MKNRGIAIAAVALIVAAAAFFGWRDYDYRQTHGRVTEVTLFSWDQEVDQVKNAEPVLVYFYKDDGKNAADPAQSEAVAGFAWRHAGEVKVVAVNCAHLENLPLALGHGTVRFPGFAVITKNGVVTGTAGKFADKAELNRLLELAQKQQP